MPDLLTIFQFIGLLCGLVGAALVSSDCRRDRRRGSASGLWEIRPG